VRSATEIAFRLRQELTNVVLLLSPPSFQSTPGAAHLPDARTVATALRETAYAQQVRQLADQIRAHRFPVLGTTLDTGPTINWRRDYVNGKETPTDYFRLIPYLDPQRAGDHKIVWELNRHQHLVLLAQAYLLGGGESNLAEIYAQLESWEAANPLQRGINWASALEVAFRAVSWLWIHHLVGDEMPAGLRSRFLESLFRHCRHIENNLSFYFSPNTHLLGEAVALHALGQLFPDFRDLGAHVVADQMDKQVRDDGSHFEQSTYYHVYALDMFLFHAVLEDVSVAYRTKLERMAEYLHAILGPQRSLPFIGDDDGGRFFHPYGRRDHFGRATMAACSVFLKRPEWLGSTDDLHEMAAWWLGTEILDSKPDRPVYSSQYFENAGIAVMTAGDRHILIDAGPFGPWGSGHSHSDSLSLVIRAGERDILIDPGTYTYVGSERDWFRGSIAHNTIRIDGADQATPLGPFRWTDQPQVRANKWESSPGADHLDAECSYSGFTHRRRVHFEKPDTIHIVDEISGPPGEHEIEQLWHPASVEAEHCLVLDGEPDRLEGWRSDAYGEKRSSTVLRIFRKTDLPLKLESRILLK
jgi:hypothetical protein